MVLFWACGTVVKFWDIVNSITLQDVSLKFKIQTNDVCNYVKFLTNETINGFILVGPIRDVNKLNVLTFLKG